MYDKSQHLLSLRDWSAERIRATIDEAIRLKAELKTQGPSRLLQGRTIALYFEKPSLRTSTTFQVGAHQLGGDAVMLDPGSIGIGKRESIADVARCLSRWVDGIVIRCFKQELVEKLAEFGSVPVINALTDDFHPCQALAFGQTMVEHFGELKGRRVCFVGDGNNVANDLMLLAAKTGMHFTLACPQGFEQPAALVAETQAEFAKHGGSYTQLRDPSEGVRNADVIYTDVWVSMGQEGEGDSKKSHFIPYRVDGTLLAKAPKGCKVSHCLPAHRGEEITDAVMDDLVVNLSFDEAENRLHAQKAVMAGLVKKR